MYAGNVWNNFDNDFSSGWVATMTQSNIHTHIWLKTNILLYKNLALKCVVYIFLIIL